MIIRERPDDTLRPVKIIPNFTEMAAGSALIECGRTRVLCTASVSESVPPFLKGKGQGWLTAEYAMLPGSTPERKSREFMKRDGRSVEIQRLIGRSLRSALNMEMLGERTVTIDCDVLQADGGTRTASITGGFVALCLAVNKLMKEGKLFDSPIVRQVAAVSCGMVDDRELLDLEYVEDSSAQADMNVVAASDGKNIDFTEVQITGERRTVSRKELMELMDIGEKGIKELMDKQREALGDAAGCICAKKKLIVASGNFGKIREFRAMLGDRYDVMSAREAGVEMKAEETGETFTENALIKANEIFAQRHCAVIADDSGLCVDALNGAPGVHSARYSGVHGDDALNRKTLLENLAKLGDCDRSACFCCSIVMLRPGCEAIVAEGRSFGNIAFEEKGDNGFGYDSLFISDDLGITFAEASDEAKNGISHRGRAVVKLMEMLGEDK